MSKTPRGAGKWSDVIKRIDRDKARDADAAERAVQASADASAMLRAEPDINFFMFRCLVAEAMGILGDRPRAALEDLYVLLENEFLEGRPSRRLLQCRQHGKEPEHNEERDFDLALHMYLRRVKIGWDARGSLKDARAQVSAESGFSDSTLKDIWKANWKDVKAFIEQYGIPAAPLPKK